MKTNGSSAKGQEIGSKRKRMNQDKRTAKHIAWHASGFQGHHPQQRPTRNGGSLTPSLGRGKDFHVSGDRFFLTTNPYQQDVESRYIQDKKNGVITCLVCGKEGHYSCNCRLKDHEHKIVCTVCGKNGHCSMWCCRQNKSESRACTRCGEIGHSTTTHGGLGCSSCDEHHEDGECRLSGVKCFLCESQDHYLAHCPWNSMLTGTGTAKKSSGMKPKSKVRCLRCGEEGHRPRRCPLRYRSLAMYKPSPLVTADNTPTGVLTCFRCKEEGHYAKRCPQKHHKCHYIFNHADREAASEEISAPKDTTKGKERYTLS